MYTKHGYHITGSGEELGAKPPKARCGGPGLCADCTAQAEAWIDENRPTPEGAEPIKLTAQETEGPLPEIDNEELATDLSETEATPPEQQPTNQEE